MDRLTWEDGGVLCGLSCLGSLAIWLPDGLAHGRSRQKTERGWGHFYSLSFTAVLPEAVVLLGGPSFMALALTGL